MVADKILMVDDDAQLLSMYATRLKLAGYDVALAHNAEQALDLVAKQMPQLLTIDIMMPSRNGLALIKQLRKQYLDRLCPIIVLSNLSSVQIELNHEVANILGLAHYVTKAQTPPHSLVELIDETIKLRRSINGAI